MRNDIEKLRAGLALRQYVQHYRKLETVAKGHNIGLGRVRWLQGDSLIKAREKCKCKRKPFKTYLVQNGIPKSSAYLYIRIATLVLEDRSFTLGYHEMLEVVYPSFRHEIKDDATSEFGDDKASTHNNEDVPGLKITRSNRKPKRQRRTKSQGKRLTLDQITSGLVSIDKSTEHLATAKHDDNTQLPTKTLRELTHALHLVASTQRNLRRVQQSLNQRIIRIRKAI